MATGKMIVYVLNDKDYAMHSLVCNLEKYCPKLKSVWVFKTLIIKFNAILPVENMTLDKIL